MASAKTITSFQEKVSALQNEDQAEKLFSSISKSQALSEDEKQSLNVSIQTKLNSIQQEAHDQAVASGDKEAAVKAIQTGDPDQLDAQGKKIDSKRPLLSEAERSEGQEEKPIHVPANCKKKIVEIGELNDLQKKGVLVGSRPIFNGKQAPVKFTAIYKMAVLAMLMILGTVGSAFSAIESDDVAVFTDFTRSEGFKIDADGNLESIGTTENVKFRGELLANGRYGSTVLTLASSTTSVGTSSVPYVAVLKAVGGVGGLDSMGIGTTLPNGTPGQVLSLLVTGLQGSGTWIVTPTTKSGFTKITFDTKGDSVTLLYVDDTTGWIIVSNGGASITQA
jgi:hypothetical protein